MPGLKPFEVTKAVPAADASARAAEPSLLLNRSAAKLLPAMRTQSSIAWPTRIKAATRDWASWLQGSATAEMEHGRLFLFSPVFLGAGAVLWFELASDPPTMRLMAWVVVLALVAMAAGQGRPFVRSSALAGLLCIAGMLSAQYETRSRATVILDTPVTTTITGRVERREGMARVVGAISSPFPALSRLRLGGRQTGFQSSRVGRKNRSKSGSG